METVCEILTTDLEGGAARIPFSLFKELFTYLAEIDGEIPKEHVDTVIEHLSYDVWVISKHTWLHFLACIASVPAQAKSKVTVLIRQMIDCTHFCPKQNTAVLQSVHPGSKEPHVRS